MTEISIEGLQKEKNELVKKRTQIIDRLKAYKSLQYRSVCPHCESEINRDYFKNKIPELESTFKIVDTRLDEIIPIIIERNTEKAYEREKLQREHRKQLNDYITLNKNKLNKVIRDYNKGVEEYMPSILDSEKELWNEAMETHLANRNMDDTNEELLFEV